MKNFKLALIVICLSLLFFSFNQVLAIGQMTQPIVIKDALRGSDYQEKLTLLNSVQNELVYDLKAEGQIAEWATFYEITDTKLEKPVTKITVPAGQYQDATVKFSIPESAANGDYNGSIAVKYTPTDAKSTATSTALTQSVSRNVTISISDKEVINFNISVIPAKYDVLPDEALSIRLIYDNQSNIVITPLVDLKIKNADQSVYNASFPFPEDLTPVKPGTQQEITALTIPTNGWALGSYNAVFKFKQGDYIVDKDFTFSIRKESMLPASDNIGIFSNSNWMLWLLAILLLAIIGYLIKKYLYPADNKNLK